MRWLDGISDSMDMSLGDGDGQGAWRAIVHGVAKSWTQLVTEQQAASIKGLSPETSQATGVQTQYLKLIGKASLSLPKLSASCLVGQTWARSIWKHLRVISPSLLHHSAPVMSPALEERGQQLPSTSSSFPTPTIMLIS